MTASMLKMNRDMTELLVLNDRHRPLPSLTTFSVFHEEINRSREARNIEITQKNDKNEDASIPLFSVEDLDSSK